MFKKLPKIITLFFLIIFLLQVAGLIFLLGAADSCSAYDPITFEPNVEGIIDSGAITIGNYVKAIYKYAIGIVGILATVVMMWGGVIWITAGGNTERISNAKSWISASLTGLVLALASYTILYTINPNLVKFEPINPDEVGESQSCCDPSKGSVSSESTEVGGVIKFSCPTGSIPCTNNQTCETNGSSYACRDIPNTGSDCTSDSQCNCSYGDTPQCLYNGDDPPKQVCFCT